MLCTYYHRSIISMIYIYTYEEWFFHTEITLPIEKIHNWRTSEKNDFHLKNHNYPERFNQKGKIIKGHLNSSRMHLQ